MASEQVLDIPVRRHVLTSERPFHVVLDGICTGISQPDIAALLAKLAASTSATAPLTHRGKSSLSISAGYRRSGDHESNQHEPWIRAADC